MLNSTVRGARSILEDVILEWRREFSNMIEENLSNWEGYKGKSINLIKEEMAERQRTLRDSLLEGKITQERYYAEIDELDRQFTDEKAKRIGGFAKLWQDIMDSMKKFWIKLLAEMVAEWIAAQMKKLAINLLTNAGIIKADTASAGVKAVKSAAGIPFPLNIAAIGAAVAFVATMIKNITGLATGGVVTSPMLAQIGEGKGREAVLPLDDPRAMTAIAEAIGGGGRQVTFQDTYILQGPTMIEDTEAWDRIYKQKIVPAKRRSLEELRNISGVAIE